jgi:hypothetical protein
MLCGVSDIRRPTRRERICGFWFEYTSNIAHNSSQVRQTIHHDHIHRCPDDVAGLEWRRIKLLRHSGHTRSSHRQQQPGLRRTNQSHSCPALLWLRRVKEYQCWLYCDSAQEIGDWAECAKSNTTYEAPGPFCQGELTPNNTETLTSSAFHSSTPKYNGMIFALVCMFLFLGPAQATIVPSLDNGLVKRQSGSGCSLIIDSNYTSLQHGSKMVAGPLTCQNSPDSICAFEAPVVTPLNENNRTLNGSSAAEPTFDAFFDVVSNSTGGRKLPAMSSINITHGIAAKGDIKIALEWTPISV